MMEMASDSGSLRCCICSTECVAYRKLKKHYKKKHQEYELMRCLLCKFVTVSQSDMKKHYKREHPKHRFTCSHCMFSSRSWNKWKQHEVSVHSGESVPATEADSSEMPSCDGSRHVDKQSHSLLGLDPDKNEHEKCELTHDSWKQLPGISARGTSSLDKDSLNISHLDVILEASTVRNVSKLASPTDLPIDSSQSSQGVGVHEVTCSQCATSRQHKHLKSDVCSRCAFSSEHQHSLASHEDSSTHKSLYKCELCKKQFAKKINLTYHMRTHTNDRPYQCEYCEYASSQKTTLEQHLRGHLGIKPYKCQQCEYSTAYKSNLVFHAVTHSIDRPFSCDFCSKRFKRKDHLSVHIRRKHADMV